MSEQAVGELVVRKSVTVACGPERAFRVFTEGIAAWWPLETHSVGEKDAETVVLEGREGGRFYERLRSGEEHDWGHVTVWDPPSRLSYTWYPGRGQGTAGEVEMRFVPDGAGTRVELEHRGWENYGPGVDEMVKRYETGWEHVLDRYADSAA